MSKYGYQNKETDEKGLAYARVDGVDASYRDLCNVCSNIRGRRTDAAIAFLTSSLKEQRPIRTPRHNKRRGHVRSLGGKKGGWPQKSIKIVLKVLQNAAANAQNKGLGDSKIIHIAANKQEVYGRIASKGRRQRSDYETAFVEVVVRELKSEENMLKKKRLAEQKKAEEQAKKREAEKKASDAKQADKKDVKPKTEDVKTQAKAKENKEVGSAEKKDTKKTDEKKSASVEKKKDTGSEVKEEKREKADKKTETPEKKVSETKEMQQQDTKKESMPAEKKAETKKE